MLRSMIVPALFISTTAAFGVGCSKCSSSSSEMSIKNSTDNSPNKVFDPQGGPQSFGKPLSPSLKLTPLEIILENPEDFKSQTVQTSGVVKRVCKVMGCWIEIENEKKQAIQIPMAGHTFTVPKNSFGAHATIEGVVKLRELREDEKEHLKKEGAQAVDVGVQIEATGVILRPLTSKQKSES